MSINALNTPWTRTWRCVLCAHTYRFDFSAEDGGPKELFSGHCDACTCGILATLRAFEMVEGTDLSGVPWQLTWSYSGRGITCMPMNEYNYGHIDNGIRAKAWERVQAQISYSEKVKKTKPKKTKKPKVEITEDGGFVF